MCIQYDNNLSSNKYKYFDNNNYTITSHIKIGSLDKVIELIKSLNFSKLYFKRYLKKLKLPKKNQENELKITITYHLINYGV